MIARKLSLRDYAKLELDWLLHCCMAWFLASPKSRSRVS